MLRFLKYGPGNYFRPHCDLTYTDKQGHESMVTVQIYLNEEFEGGETTFYDCEEKAAYVHKPERGDILLFDQDIEHSGDDVISGIKYSMRTELMYEMRENIHEMGHDN